jgi:phage gpG-like protein
MSVFKLKGWRAFGVNLRRPVINSWLRVVRAKSQEAFARGMLGNHTGQVYRRKGGRTHQASAPGEFPANDTGGLLASLKSHQRKDEATIGTDTYYARFLRDGTRHMARRRMSDDALKAGRKAAADKSRGWIGFQRDKQKVRNLND